jgi:hypothetical protein
MADGDGDQPQTAPVQGGEGVSQVNGDAVGDAVIFSIRRPPPEQGRLDSKAAITSGQSITATAWPPPCQGGR